MLTIEINAFKSIVSFDPKVNLEEDIFVPILQEKGLCFRGEI